MTIDLLVRHADTEPYVDGVRLAADAERDALGFLPASAYAEFSYQNRLVVAVDAGTRTLSGYVIFGGAMPQGRIFQTWVDPKFRNQHVGHQLIEEVVRKLEAANYLSIRADVADDLSGANRFYESVGFEKIRSRAGGESRKRSINVRVRELATPSLLDWADRSEVIGGLSLATRAGARTPLYVLDLNVLFDVTKRRLRAAEARRVMSAAFENDFRLAVSSELIVELQRNTPAAGEPDPTLEFAKTLPRLASPPSTWTDGLVIELATHIFPDRARGGMLTRQDNSDLIHLLTAIHECATGFVTSEKAILRAANYLKLHHHLDVLSPDTLAPREAGFSPKLLTTATDRSQVSRPIVDSDYDAVSAFVLGNHGSASAVRELLSSGTASLPRRRFIILADDAVRAVGAWDAPNVGSRPRELQIYMAEADPFAAQYADHLVARALADIGSHYPSLFEIQPPVGQSTLRKIAINSGFFPVGGKSPRTQKLRKIALGSSLGPENWSAAKSRIEERTGIVLPASAPMFTSASQSIDIRDHDGKHSLPSLSEVERFFSPILLSLPERPAVILPITQGYAEELFRGSAQPTLMSDREAVWHPTRLPSGSGMRIRRKPRPARNPAHLARRRPPDELHPHKVLCRRDVLVDQSSLHSVTCPKIVIVTVAQTSSAATN